MCFRFLGNVCYESFPFNIKVFGTENSGGEPDYINRVDMVRNERVKVRMGHPTIFQTLSSMQFIIPSPPNFSAK